MAAVTTRNLGRHGASLPYDFWQQDLRDNAFKYKRELCPHLALLMTRKHINHAIDRLSRAVGMQRREYKVTGFRNCQGRLNRFQVAHFANQNHIGVFTQRVLQCRRKTFRVGANFALVDDAVAVPVDELDRGLRR